jgi:hypothetical protein
VRKSKIEILDLNETPKILEVSEKTKGSKSGITTDMLKLESLGFKKGMWTEFYIHGKKEVGNTVYRTWIEISKMPNVGYVIQMGVHTDNPELIMKLALRMRQIFNELKNEGYEECD